MRLRKIYRHLEDTWMRIFKKERPREQAERHRSRDGRLVLVCKICGGMIRADGDVAKAILRGERGWARHIQHCPFCNRTARFSPAIRQI